MRLKTCANCVHYGDEQKELNWSNDPLGTCRVDAPQLVAPTGQCQFPLMPSDGWCSRHGDFSSSTPTHTTADSVEIGPAVDQPH